MADEDHILWELVEQHLDEAEFCFEVWASTLDAPNYTLEEIAEGPEARLLAHVDGLVIGGRAVARELLWPALDSPVSSEERCAAATMALTVGLDAEGWARLLGLLDEAQDERRRGLVRGLQLGLDLDADSMSSNPAAAERRLLADLEGASTLGVSARLEVLAGRQHVPGPWLRPHLDSADVATARAAVTLARFGGPEGLRRLDPPPGIWDRLGRAEDPELREATITTALLLGVQGAWASAAYWAFAAPEPAMRRAAATWVAVLGDASAHARLLADLDDPELRRTSAWACAHAGRPDAVEAALPLLDDPEFGPLAAELPCAVAGLPVDRDELWRDPPPETAAESLPPLDADDLDEDLVPDAEAQLPLPDPAAIRAWWANARATLDDNPSLRHHAGRPLDAAGLRDALTAGPARWRHVQAMELALRSRGRALVNTRALARTQQRQLASLSLDAVEDCQRGMALP
ncbi:hypothetical protein PPSIR1_07703 [Plesiocystis pacifica SIR-1]|uniref:TIGR02270 family protein n=1 Tax=Plesiocystis pacifica SIR-1 TaxID=391625 RepID=A6GD62_9BACT|nr:hypothetical protein [Plesiocystis pacifica]EDM76220.1 hypothetical protein PPSIR1_07703 [Plesiocystis pacifica SIR-1]